MSFNDITIRPAKKEIMLSDGAIYHYNSPSSSTNDVHVIRRAHAVPLCQQRFGPVNFSR